MATNFNLDDRIKAAVNAAFEEAGDEGSIAEDSQQIDGVWFNPSWGCDTMQHFIDALKRRGEGGVMSRKQKAYRAWYQKANAEDMNVQTAFEAGWGAHKGVAHARTIQELQEENKRMRQFVAKWDCFNLDNIYKDSDEWRNRMGWLDDVLMTAVGNWIGPQRECFDEAIERIKFAAMDAARGTGDDR